MLIRRPKGTTHVVGKSQGYLSLPLRAEVIDCPVSGPGTVTLTTAWEPTPEELARLNAGASIEVMIHGTAHPPIMLSVGEVPE